MLQPKKGFENTDVSYRLGTTRININTNNITQNHIDVAKRYGIDLTMYVENVVHVEVPEELLDIQEPIKQKANAKRKKAPNKNISKS